MRGKRIRGATPELETAAREMRRAATPAETILWQQLRRGWLGGHRFRRQHPVGRFILDLYCADRKLAIELDGQHHAEEDQSLRDEERTAVLRGYGIRVLRFRNEEVLNDMESVLARIAGALGPRHASEADPDASDPASAGNFCRPSVVSPSPKVVFWGRGSGGGSGGEGPAALGTG
ncbi:MAG TPA: endonuclease domain-containing protein [Longimicrobium sp.]|nr:endonuclease domain-containing protein [Longimicrobium sp.]